MRKAIEGLPKRRIGRMKCNCMFEGRKKGPHSLTLQALLRQIRKLNLNYRKAPLKKGAELICCLKNHSTNAFVL